MRVRYILIGLLIALLSACGGGAAPAEESAAETEATTEAVVDESSAEEDATAEEAAAVETEEPEVESEETSAEAPEATAEEVVEEESSAEEPSSDEAIEESVSEEEMELAAEFDFPEEDVITTDSGLQYVILEEGGGDSPAVGDIVQVHYTGKLKNGETFDSSVERGEPIRFPLGIGQVIPGWDEGIDLMNIGDKYVLIIPAELGYGEQGTGPIPPNATLYFEVELVEFEPGAPVDPAEVDEADYTETDSGLKYYDIEEGDGDAPEEGSRCTIHFTIWVQDGELLDSSLFKEEPFTFPLGVGQLMPGWEEGVSTMKVGGKRQLVIPPELGYGEQGLPGLIPPNSTLVIETELLDVGEGVPTAPTEVDEADYTETESGLKYYDFEEGDGDTPEEGQQVTVHYTGWLEDGTLFDSSLFREESFSFPLGMGQVIAGWDEGVSTMNVGGKRQLVIPPDLAYGEQGAGNGVIPPDATLIFEVELLEVGE